MGKRTILGLLQKTNRSDIKYHNGHGYAEETLRKN